MTASGTGNVQGGHRVIVQLPKPVDWRLMTHLYLHTKLSLTEDGGNVHGTVLFFSHTNQTHDGL